MKIDKKLLAGIVTIVAITFLFYARVWNNGFIWDDDSYITKNETLKTLEGLKRIWIEPGATHQYYPLTFTVLWIEHKLWGYEPLGYHLVNVFLHALNAILIWFILRRLMIGGAFFAACLFAVHPVHVESVAWVTELKNVLSGAFYLLSLWFYLVFWEKKYKNFGLYGISLFLFICGLLSKTVVCTLPVIVLLILWWKADNLKPKDIKYLIPHFFIGVLLGIFTAWFERHTAGAHGIYWDFSLLERCLLAAKALWFYAGKLIWPHPLLFFYPRWTIDATEWIQYIPLLGTFVLLIGLWSLRKKTGKGALVAVLFFITSLFPALGFFNIYFMRYSLVANHFNYLSSLGILVLLSAIGASFLRKYPQYLRYGISIALILVLGILTQGATTMYKNEMTLYNSILTTDPNNLMAYNNRGLVYESSGQYDLALSDYEKAIELGPAFVEAHNNRGLLYEAKGQYDLALADYNRILMLEPQYQVHYNRGNIYFKLKQYDLALFDYNRAILLNPKCVDAYNNRAIVYSLLGQYNLAIKDYTRALSIKEDYTTYYNRGLVYEMSHQYAMAISDYSKVLTIDTKNANVYFRRSLLNEQEGNIQGAFADALKAQSFGYTVDPKYFNRLESKLDNHIFKETDHGAK